ncbi:hypothetical protein CsSME_00003445 [Camellia sinensis var. sinensis]
MMHQTHFSLSLSLSLCLCELILSGKLMGVFSVFSRVTFICGSRRAMTRTLSRRKKERIVRLGNKKKPIARLQSNLSSKALLMVKMISWRKVDQHEDEQEKDEDEGFDGSDEAVWRRTIMMGEKCRPLDFSGKILYDCHGNLLPSS